MADARQMLKEALSQLDAETKMERYEVTRAIEAVATAAKDACETIDELRFEQIAAELALYDEPNVWGTFFGPWLTQETARGRLDRPSLDGITAACIEYWSTRMDAAKHPAMRARYADAVWDLSLKVTGSKPPIDAARIAIDSYIDALYASPRESFHSWDDIQRRAINLALLINDEDRLRKAVTAIKQYASAQVEPDEYDFRQRALYDVLRQIPANRRPQAEFQAIVDDFCARLNELDAAQADKFTIQDIALPLADYYWSSQQRDEAKAVLRIWGAAVERLANATTMSMLASGWLRELHEVYQRYEMHDEARELVAKIEPRRLVSRKS